MSAKTSPFLFLRKGFGEMPRIDMLRENDISNSFLTWHGFNDVAKGTQGLTNSLNDWLVQSQHCYIWHK